MKPLNNKRLASMNGLNPYNENCENFDDGLTRVAPEGEFKTGKEIYFKYEYYPTKEKIINFIQQDEGRCIQQSVYSTFHDALTQINFSKKIIRSNIKI